MFQFQIITTLYGLPLEFRQLILVFCHCIPNILFFSLELLCICFPLLQVFFVAVGKIVLIVDHLVAVIDLRQEIFLIFSISKTFVVVASLQFNMVDEAAVQNLDAASQRL